MCQLFLRACSPCCGVVVVASKEKAFLEEVSFYRVVGGVQNVADGGCFESIKKKLSVVVWAFFFWTKDDDQNFFVFSSCVFWNFVDEREPQKNIKNVFVEFIIIILFSSSSRFKNRKKKKSRSNK